ncbi:hypothetical protein C0J52_02301 [Blattella germanica]|nr:hypothetical protein C0J52_02301 [Blattella germanica]
MEHVGANLTWMHPAKQLRKLFWHVKYVLRIVPPSDELEHGRDVQNTFLQLNIFGTENHPSWDRQ